MLKLCFLETVADSLKILLKVSSYTFYCTFSAQNLDTKEGGKKSHSRSLMGNFGKHKVSKMIDSVCCSRSDSISGTLGMFYCLRQVWCVWGQWGKTMWLHLVYLLLLRKILASSSMENLLKMITQTQEKNLPDQKDHLYQWCGIADVLIKLAAAAEQCRQMPWCILVFQTSVPMIDNVCLIWGPLQCHAECAD